MSGKTLSVDRQPIEPDSQWAPPPARWFAEDAVTAAVDSLREQAARAASADARSRPDESARMIRGTVIILGGALVLLFAGLIAMAYFDPSHQLTASGILRAAGLLGLVLLIIVFGARRAYRLQSDRGRQREEALRQLTARTPGLRLANFTPITGPSVGVIPWLATELDIKVQCDLQGSYGGRSVVVLECTQVLDLTLARTEATFGRVGATIVSHLQHDAVIRRSLEAVVFFEPLPAIPDVFLCSQSEPLHWYFKRSCEKVGLAIRVVEDEGLWVACSDPDACDWDIPPGLRELLMKSPGAALQVLGGHCVLITRAWDWNRPAEMPNDAEEIGRNLDLAVETFESLHAAKPTDPIASAVMPTSNGEPYGLRARPCGDPEDPECVGVGAPAHPDLRWAGACLGALLLGGLALAAVVPQLPADKLIASHLMAEAFLPALLGGWFGARITRQAQLKAYRRLLAPVAALVAGCVAAGLELPRMKPQETPIAGLLAAAFIPMLLGGLGGAILGRLLRRKGKARR